MNRIPPGAVRGAAIALVLALPSGCKGGDLVEPLQRLDEIVLVPVLMENAASSRIHILASHEDFHESNRLEPGQARQVTVGFVETESDRGTVIWVEVFRAGSNDTPTSRQACKINTLILNNTDIDPDNLPPGEVRWEGGALHCGGSIENESL